MLHLKKEEIDMDATTYQTILELPGMSREMLQELYDTYFEQRQKIQIIMYSSDLFMEDHLQACFDHLSHMIKAIEEELMREKEDPEEA